MMRTLAVSLGLLLSVGWTAWAETLVVGESSATFESPPGFRALTNAEIERKFPRSRGGQQVVGNDTLGTTIAYGATASPFTEDDLPQMQRTFTEMFEEASPGIEWIRNDIAEMRSKPWVYMEFTSEAADSDIHNIVLFTTHEGQVVMFNFNSRTGEFPQYEAALRQSIDSIRLGAD